MVKYPFDGRTRHKSLAAACGNFHAYMRCAWDLILIEGNALRPYSDVLLAPVAAPSLYDIIFPVNRIQKRREIAHDSFLTILQFHVSALLYNLLISREIFLNVICHFSSSL